MTISAPPMTTQSATSSASELDQFSKQMRQLQKDQMAFQLQEAQRTMIDKQIQTVIDNNKDRANAAIQGARVQ